MAIFGLAPVPVIERLKRPNVVQCWFANDAVTGARIQHLRQWWEVLKTVGSQYGYYPNEVKTYLVVKPGKDEEARDVFCVTEVQITMLGQKVSGRCTWHGSFRKRVHGEEDHPVDERY